MSKKTRHQVRKSTSSTTAPSPNAPILDVSRGASRSDRDFNPDYSYVKKDLRRIGILAGTFIVVLIVFVNRFKAGRAMRAVAQDEDAARLQGVSIRYISTLIMALACGLGAIAGGLMAPVFMIVPTMGLPFLLKTVIAITIGGIGSIGGAVLGALIVGMVESYVSTLISIEVAYIALFGMLALILVVKPGGFFGTPYEYV